MLGTYQRGSFSAQLLPISLTENFNSWSHFGYPGGMGRSRELRRSHCSLRYFQPGDSAGALFFSIYGTTVNATALTRDTSGTFGTVGVGVFCVGTRAPFTSFGFIRFNNPSKFVGLNGERFVRSPISAGELLIFSALPSNRFRGRTVRRCGRHGKRCVGSFDSSCVFLHACFLYFLFTSGYSFVYPLFLPQRIHAVGAFQLEHSAHRNPVVLGNL